MTPARFFLGMALLFGLIFLFLTPPFQVPDEVNHFYRAYQIADGGFMAEQHTQRLGGYIPRSLIKVAGPFLDLRWQMNRKTSYELIWDQMNIKLHPHDKIFMDFPNTALYNPVSYLPQSFVICILRQFNLRPLIIFYATRIFSLLIWILCLYFLIKSLAAFRWLFVFLALLPMSVFINMGISADIITNIVVFLFLGFMINQIQSTAKFQRIDFLKLVLFVILLASAKIVYLPLIFLYLLIPRDRFSQLSVFSLQFIGLLALGIGIALFWSGYIAKAYIPFDQYNVAFRNFLDLPRCANMEGQMAHILDNPFYVVNVFFNSMYRTFNMYYPGYIGTFGWLDTKLPEWIIHSSYLVLTLVAIFDRADTIKFSWWQRFMLIFTAISVIAALLLSQLLSWECVGNDFIKTIQGRYFIPIFPLIFLAINGFFNRLNRQKFIGLLVVVHALFLLIISNIVIFRRYYVYPVYDVLEIKCDVESVKDNKLVTNLSGVLLDNADRRTEEMARSGQYSLKLSKDHPFGFTYKVQGGHYGDVIELEVWRLGDTGGVTIAGDGGKAFYVGNSDIRYVRDGDWNRLVYSYTLEEDMEGKEIAIYVFNKFEVSYFDDIVIRIKRRKTIMSL